MDSTIQFVTARMIFQVIKVLYNDYNYYILIINYITKLFMKRTRNDISAYKSKPRSYRIMSMSILIILD